MVRKHSFSDLSFDVVDKLFLFFNSNDECIIYIMQLFWQRRFLSSQEGCGCFLWRPNPESPMRRCSRTNGLLADMNSVIYTGRTVIVVWFLPSRQPTRSLKVPARKGKGHLV